MQPQNIWVGIDCGKHGAAAIVYPNNKVESWHTPSTTIRTKKRKKSAAGKTTYSSKTEYTLAGMLAILRYCSELKQAGHNVLVTIEQQRQRPTDSKQTVFQVGYGQGLWEMACAANDLEFVKVLPSQWKPKYVPLGATKKDSIHMCRKLYPKHLLPLAKDEARAEAILIADYTMRMRLNKEFPRKVV